MFFTRLISGIVLLAIVIAAIIAGGNWFFFLVGVLAVVGLNELYRARRLHMEARPFVIVGNIACVVYLLGIWLDVDNVALAVIIGGFLIMMSVYVFSFPKYHADQVAFAVFGIIYVPVLMTCLYQIRMLGDGLFIIPLVFVSAWGNDTCAYVVGMLFGKHKMAPRLSPKKSVEGGVGGIVGAVILGMLYGYFFGDKLPTLASPVLACAVMCGAGALIAVVGDLGASAIKRDMEIKDYGKLIPGHGGVLDRFDSILFTAPVVYFIAYYLGV